MKAILGILSLVIVLAIVGSLAKKQLQAYGAGSSRASVGAAGASTAGPSADRQATVSQQARGIEQKVGDDVARALQQGTERNEQADR